MSPFSVMGLYTRVARRFQQRGLMPPPLPTDRADAANVLRQMVARLNAQPAGEHVRVDALTIRDKEQAKSTPETKPPSTPHRGRPGG